MRGTILPLPQNALMAWPVKVQGQLYLYQGNLNIVSAPLRLNSPRVLPVLKSNGVLLDICAELNDTKVLS